MSKDWKKTQSENDLTISSVKSDISKLKKDLNSAEKKLSNSNTDYEALKELMDKIVSDLQGKMDLAETTINEQHNQAQESVLTFQTCINYKLLVHAQILTMYLMTYVSNIQYLHSP